MKLFSSVKKFFFSKYVSFYQIVTLTLLSIVSKRVRKLLVLQGKNPDYVSPPPPPPPEDKSDKWARLDKEVMDKRVSKAYEFNRIHGLNNSNSWVKKPSEHPVLKARCAYENKKASPPVEEPLQVAASVTAAEEDFHAFNGLTIENNILVNRIKED